MRCEGINPTQRIHLVMRFSPGKYPWLNKFFLVVNNLLLNLVTDQVTVHLHVLGVFVEDMIICNVDYTSIVPKDGDRLLVRNARV